MKRRKKKDMFNVVRGRGGGEGGGGGGGGGEGGGEVGSEKVKEND